MVEETERVTTEGRYWDAVMDLNAKRHIPEATAALQEIAGGRGSVAGWARQTLADKLGCHLPRNR